jgi:hypothetical protein
MQAIHALPSTRVGAWTKMTVDRSADVAEGPAMGNNRVLVAAGTREYVCVGPHAAARHAPHQVPIEGERGQCSRCELQVTVWDDAPDL